MCLRKMRHDLQHRPRWVCCCLKDTFLKGAPSKMRMWRRTQSVVALQSCLPKKARTHGLRLHGLFVQSSNYSTTTHPQKALRTWSTLRCCSVPYAAVLVVTPCTNLGALSTATFDNRAGAFQQNRWLYGHVCRRFSLFWNKASRNK